MLNSSRRVLVLTGLLGLFVVPLAAQSSSPPDSSLPSSEVSEFLGEWTLNLEMQGTPVELKLVIGDHAGIVVASVSSESEPDPRTITTISRDNDTLKLEWERDYNGQQVTLVMDLRRIGETLAGTFGDTSGFFSAEVVGGLGGAPSLSATTAGSGNVDQLRRRRRRAGAQSTVTLAGKEIVVAYDPLSADTADYESFAGLGTDEVASWLTGRAIKLKIDADLRFGDAVVRYGNVAADYAGVYSLWPQRVAAGWRLIFNEQPDIWGSQRLPEADVASSTLQYEALETDVDKLTVELIEVGAGGLLRIAWGRHQLTTPFELAD